MTTVVPGYCLASAKFYTCSSSVSSTGCGCSVALRTPAIPLRVQLSQELLTECAAGVWRVVRKSVSYQRLIADDECNHSLQAWRLWRLGDRSL